MDSVISDRRHQFKKTVDSNEVRLRGIDNAMESRKAQRRELMNAKRQKAFADNSSITNFNNNNNVSVNSQNGNTFVNAVSSTANAYANAFPLLASRSALKEAHPSDVCQMLAQAKAMSGGSDNNGETIYQKALAELNASGYISLITQHLKTALENSAKVTNNDCSHLLTSPDCGVSTASTGNCSDNESTACSDDDSAAVNRSFRQLSKNVNSTCRTMSKSNSSFNTSPAGTVRACLSIVCNLTEKNVDWVMQLRGGSTHIQLIDVIFNVFNFNIATEKEIVFAVLEIIGNICADNDHRNLRSQLLEKNVFSIVRGILEILFSNSKPPTWTETDSMSMASMSVWILRNSIFACNSLQIEEAVSIFTRLLELSKNTNTQLVEECVAGLTEVIEKSNGKFLKAVLICGQADELRTHLDVHKKNLIIEAVVNLCSGKFIEECVREGKANSEFVQAKQNRAVGFDFVKRVLKTTSGMNNKRENSNSDETKGMMDNFMLNSNSNSAFPSSSSTAPAYGNNTSKDSISIHRQVGEVLVNNNLVPAICNFLRSSAKIENAENSNSILPDVIDSLKILTLLVSEATHLQEINPVLRQGVFLLLRAVGQKFIMNQKFMIELVFCYSKFFIVINDLLDKESKMVHSQSWRNLLWLCLDEEGMKNCGQIKSANVSVYANSMFNMCNTKGAANMLPVNADLVGIVFDFFTFSTNLMSNIIDSSSTNWLVHAKLLNEVSACACFLRKQFSLPGNEAPNNTPNNGNSGNGNANCTAIVLKATSDLVSSNKAILENLKESVLENRLAFPCDSVLFKMDNTLSLAEFNGAVKRGRNGEYLEKGIVTCGFDREITKLFNYYFDGAFDDASTYSVGKEFARFALVEPVRNLGKPLKHYANLYIEADEDYLSSCDDEDNYFSSGSISLEMEDSDSFSCSRRHQLHHMASFVANNVQNTNTTCQPVDAISFNNASKNNQRFFENNNHVNSVNNSNDGFMSDSEGGQSMSRNSEVEAMRMFFCDSEKMKPFGAGVQNNGGFDFS